LAGKSYRNIKGGAAYACN